MEVVQEYFDATCTSSESTKLFRQPKNVFTDLDFPANDGMHDTLLQPKINFNQIVNSVNDLQAETKSSIESIISESLNKVSSLFKDDTFGSIERAISEVAGLMSIRFRDEYRQIRSEMEKSVSEIILNEFSRTNGSLDKLIYQLESLLDLAKQYETQLARRESVIEILKSEIVQTQKFAMLNVTAEHRIRKKFCTQLAFAHARRTLIRRVWTAWKRSLEESWKQRAHRRLTRESRQICIQLSEEYEIKVAELREKLRAAEEKCALAEMSRTRVQETMKSALMRGICALNIETMQVLQPESASSYVKEDNIPIPVEDGICNNGTVETAPLSPCRDQKYRIECASTENRPPHCDKSNDISPTRALSASRVTFDVPEPVKMVVRRSVNLDRTHPPNTLFRTHTVEHGIPAGDTFYSSANCGAVRVMRHESSDRVNQTPAFIYKGIQDSVRFSSMRKPIQKKTKSYNN